MKGTTVAVLAVSHIALFGVGYAVADKEPIDAVVKQTGFFQVDASRVDVAPELLIPLLTH